MLRYFNVSSTISHVWSKSFRKFSSYSEVILSEVNGCGVITLNRPKVLNALNLNMVRMIYPKMHQWASDPKITHVMIEGMGDKAFCAGGDVTAVVNAAAANDPHASDFFREEYKLNFLIGNYPKPFIALLNGITMGGGVGLSVHGRFRVATERTIFAMPETAIGLFPDVGGGYFLPRLPMPGLGLYLALTGVRLKGSDVFQLGIATSYTLSTHIEKLKSQICQLRIRDVKNSFEEINELILDHHTSVGFSEPDITHHADKIERLFHLPNVPSDGSGIEWIFENLNQDADSGDEWAKMTLATMKQMSPTSLKVTLKQLQEGMKLNLQQVLQMEFRLSQNCLLNGDFPEGVRALLISKDKNPRWNPDSVEKISSATIDNFFGHVEVGPEWQPE
ncbi:hypothetical protein Ciccas_003609 [Cichlidogyrus casuarinus]|uniref:3-hydroxyisobutyryl-CoA hydrolase, mitochondrial n=1 Tax=Cichlidogyrus casuarinus TaxID=1844966 RepID=A0ABD2QDX0_9PLAT